MSHFNFHNVAADTSELFPQVRFECRTWILNLPSLLKKSISFLICRFLIWSKQSQKTQNATGNLNSLRCFGWPSIKYLLNVMHFSISVWTLWVILEETLPTDLWSVKPQWRNNWKWFMFYWINSPNDCSQLSLWLVQRNNMQSCLFDDLVEALEPRALARLRLCLAEPSYRVSSCFCHMLKAFCFHSYPFYLKKNVFKKAHYQVADLLLWSFSTFNE